MYKIIIFFGLLFIICLSCKELYDNYQSSPDEEYLVIEGMITDNSGPFYVKINKALPYSNALDPNKNRPEPEFGALVIIKCNDGEEVVLKETIGIPGIYKTAYNELKGKIGSSYQLYIKTRNGDIYESVPATIEKTPVVSDINIKVENRPVLEKNDEGIQQMILKEGLNISANITFNHSSNYYKIDTRSLAQIQREIWRPISPCWACMVLSNSDSCQSCNNEFVYCWSEYKDIIPNTIALDDVSQNNEIKNIPLIFVFPETPVKEIEPIELEVKPLVTGYIIDIQVYSINEKIYDYYRNLGKQLIAENKIFDPIPVELTGNITCLNNPEKDIFGIFIASSVAHKQFFVKRTGTENIPVVKPLDDIYSIESANCSSPNIMPEFWQKNVSTN